MRSPSLLALLVPLAVSAAPAAALAAAPASGASHGQDGGRDPQRAIQGYERYLERKPYHDWAFDQLVEAAIALNGLGELMERYAARVAEDPEPLAPRVVLARLQARMDRLDEALETLAGTADPDAHHHRLSGALELRAGRWEQAIAALDRAAQATGDPDLLETIHRERGQALLAASERERAAEAFRALAAIDPASFHLRLEAASQLAWHGLTEEALEEFAEADALAGEDTSKRCRVLSEIGRLHERLAQGQRAVETYRQAIALMARGHWLQRDLYGRILAVHQRAGTMQELVQRCRADAADASDLDASEFLARVLVATGEREQARDVLRAAVVSFPSDLDLARSLLEVLELLEDHEGRIAEYQRILEQRPEELDLYLELGRVFASSGRFEQARRQWNKTLERRLQDAGLCVRLAGFYALFDQVDDAIAMYEKAIALEPTEIRHYADLAAFLAVRAGSEERRDELAAVLGRADAAARRAAEGGEAGRLGEVASLWNEYGEPRRAREALESALAIAGDDTRLRSRLADALIREGQLERATTILHEVVETAREGGLRGSAVDRILRLFRREERLEELLALEQQAVAQRPDALAPRLVLGRLRSQRREPDLAIEVYEELLRVQPDSEDAHKALARLYEEAGDHARALAQYGLLIEARPQTRRSYLKEIARIHLARFDQEQAFACYDEILRGAPDNPAAFAEVADAYEKLGLHDRRLECLQQAVRLRPEDARMRLELADAWRTMGEFDRAREEIAEATRFAIDEELRDDARQRLYVLLSETGRLEEEVASLRRRVEENPYDTEAPLVLTDVYVRELEYELALEMLDRLLTFQPREPKLLTEHARLLRFMERHEEAITDYETLWKLPDVDRAELALDLAEASIESGALVRAAKVLAGVSDVRRVASLYRRHDLFDEAIAVLEKGVAGAPGDGRLLLTLSRVQELVGDRRAAGETLERLLALRGDSWRVLTKLGELYHDQGREEDALATGRRLFGMLRIEETVEDEDEKVGQNPDPWRRRTYRWFSANQQYQQRLSSLQSFFQSKGWNEEFIAVGAQEMALQPTNDALYSTLLNILRQVGEREGQARELVRSLRAAALASGRAPAGTTHAAWLLRLDRDEARLYTGNSRFGDQRIAELEELLAAGNTGNTDERDLRELAQLHQTLQHDAQRLATLEAGVGAHPRSIPLRTGLAVTLYAEKRYAEAEQHYATLVELLEASDWREREAARLEQGFRQQKRSLLQQFPLHVQRRVNDGILRRLYDVTNGASTGLAWTLGSDPSLDGARMAHARCLLKLDRTEQAREVLASLEPLNPENMGRWSSLASLYYGEELYDEAEATFERMLALEAALDAESVLGHVRAWSRYIGRQMRSYARIVERRGEVLEAYELLRTYGYGSEGELLLTTHEAFDEAEQHYRAAREAAGGTLEGDPEGDPAAWREATIRLADVLQMRKRWDEVLALYEELAQRLLDDFSILEHVAALHLRAGRVDDVVATRYRIIERKRELNRRMQRDLEPEGRVLAPMRPSSGRSSSQIDALRLGGSFIVSGIGGTMARTSTGASRGPGGLYSLKQDYMAILNLHLDRHEPKQAADVLAKLAREDATTFRWMGWEMRNLIQSNQLGADALPILRLLHSYNPDDDSTSLAYGQALVQAERLDEAHKILSRLANRGRRSYYNTQQARRALERLETRMGLAGEESLAQLEGAVEADPKNVKTRMKLARRMFRERRFEGALEHGRAAEALAPHQEEVSKFVTDALTVLDLRTELEERMRRELDEETQSERRFELAVRLADWMAERGEPADALDALFERVVEHRRGGSLEYAPSSWWLERGELQRAREVLAAEIEHMGPDSNSSAQARARLATLDLTQGSPRRALEEVFERFEKATNRALRLTTFGELAGVLRALPDRSQVRPAAEALAAEWGGERGALLPAAAELALGELEAFERRVDALVDAPVGKDTTYLFLYPALVDLARQRGDTGAALERLRRLEALGEASRSRRVSTDIGNVSELVALRAEIGSLLFERGELEQAHAVWDGLFEAEERDDNRGVLARLYEEHDLHEQALALRHELLEEEDGAKDLSNLSIVAHLERELGNPDGAIPLAERALVLSAHAVDRRLFLADLHRRRGTLAEHFQELVAAAREDPDDGELARVLVQLAIELGEDEVALRTVERLADRPEQAKVLKPYLLRMKLLRGDEEGALALYEELLQGNVREYYRQRYGAQLAMVLARRGDLQRAEEVLRRSFADADGHEAWLAVSRLREELELFDEALAATEQALTLDPKASEAQARRVRVLAELGRPREALETCFEALQEPTLPHNLRLEIRRAVPKLADDAGEEQRLVAARAAPPRPEGPGPARTAYRLGLVRATQQRPAEAVEPLQAALALDPDHQGALRELWIVQRRLGRFADAERTLRTLIGILDREQVLPIDNWSAAREITGLVNGIRDLHLARGDREAALAVPVRRIGRRYRPINAYMYAYYNNPLRDTYQELGWLSSRGFHAEYVERQRLYTGLDRYNRVHQTAQMIEQRQRAGDEQALEDLWSAVYEPGRALVRPPQEGSGYYTSSPDTDDPRWSMLQRLFDEQGRIDELIGRVRAEVELWPEDPVMRPFLLSCLVRAKRWDDVVRMREEDLDRNPDDRDLELNLARALRELGRFEEALELLEELNRTQLAEVPVSSNQMYYLSGEGGPRRTTPGVVRFAWSGNRRNYAGSRYASSSGRLELDPKPADTEVRRELMALYALLGRRAEAQALEKVELSMTMLKSWGAGHVPLQMAAAYGKVGLIEDAERLALVAVAQDAEGFTSDWACRQMCLLLRQHGDEPRRRAWADRWEAYWEEQVAKAPYAEWIRLQRARVRLFELGDLEGAQEDVEQALAWNPRDPQAHLWAGFLALERAQEQAALERFQAAKRLADEAFGSLWADLQYGLGLAWAAVEGVERARPFLLQALSRGPENRYSDRARDLIE